MTTKTLDLQQIRQDIEAIDQQILRLLSQRRDIVKNVAKFKAITGKPVKDSERELQLLLKLNTFAQEQQLNLSEQSIQEIYTSIINDSCNYQTDLINSELNKKTCTEK